MKPAAEAIAASDAAPIRVLVVDDSALYRQSIANVLRDFAEAEVVGAAKNGREALEKIEALDPDLLTLDVQMPDMDGIEVLRRLKLRRSRTKAIMVSSLTSEGAQVTTEALMEGAFDFILKPSGPDTQANRATLLAELRGKISAFQESRRTAAAGLPRPAARKVVESGEVSEAAPTPRAACRAVVLGASTGGPEALKIVLPRTPRLPVPLLVVQHMPPKYTLSLANRLAAICEAEVKEAQDGEPAAGGQVLIAPGGRQMRLEQRGTSLVVRITDDPPENGVRPSVDYLLRSAVEALGPQVLAVLLTGMGRDGLSACRQLKEAGGYVFAQSREDCTVYGMPKAVVEEGLADRVLTLGKVGPAISRHVKRSRRG